MARTKMQLVSIAENVWGGKSFKFQAVYDPAIPEDQRFYAATPSAMFETSVNNPAVIAQFTLGAFYFFDTTPAIVAAPAPLEDPPTTP